MGSNPPFEGNPGGDIRPDVFKKVRFQSSDWKTWFQTSPLPIWVFNQETLCFLEANPAALHLYGYGREELLTQTIEGLFRPEDLTNFLRTVQEPAAGFVRNGVWRQKSRDGKVMDVELISCSLLVGGEPGRLVVVNDVTERRWAEQMLMQVHAHTEYQLGARTMELDAAALEVESFAQFLIQTAGRIPTSLEIDGQSIGLALAQASENLLELSRMSYLVMQPREFNLSELVRELTEVTQGTEPGRPRIFHIQPNVQVHADPAWVKQALHILMRYLVNLACEQEPAVICFGAQTRGAEVVYYLQHPTAMFDQTLLEKLFLPLLGKPGTRQNHAQDLVQVRRIIAKHSGRVWAENMAGEGVTFFFTLPAPQLPG
jgi:PAS domain S-box-containing protein